MKSFCTAISRPSCRRSSLVELGLNHTLKRCGPMSCAIASVNRESCGSFSWAQMLLTRVSFRGPECPCDTRPNFQHAERQCHVALGHHARRPTRRTAASPRDEGPLAREGARAVGLAEAVLARRLSASAGELLRRRLSLAATRTGGGGYRSSAETRRAHGGHTAAGGWLVLGSGQRSARGEITRW